MAVASPAIRATEAGEPGISCGLGAPTRGGALANSETANSSHVRKRVVRRVVLLLATRRVVPPLLWLPF